MTPPQSCVQAAALGPAQDGFLLSFQNPPGVWDPGVWGDENQLTPTEHLPGWAGLRKRAGTSGSQGGGLAQGDIAPE